MSSHHINPDYFPCAADTLTKAPVSAASPPPPLKIYAATSEAFSTSQFWIKAVFLQPDSHYSDSSRGMMSVVLTPQGSSEVTGAASQDLSEPEPRQAIIPPSPLSCCRTLPSPRCELLSVGRRDDGKMFFPTCTILSSCCGSEIEKHP